MKITLEEILKDFIRIKNDYKNYEYNSYEHGCWTIADYALIKFQQLKQQEELKGCDNCKNNDVCLAENIDLWRTKHDQYKKLTYCNNWELK